MTAGQQAGLPFFLLIKLSFHLNSRAAWTTPSRCHITDHASLEIKIAKLNSLNEKERREIFVPRFLCLYELDSEELVLAEGSRNIVPQPSPCLVQHY